MSILSLIKPRIGIFYSDENKDMEIQSMVNGAIQYFKGAGWDFSPLLSLLFELESDLEMLEIELNELQENEEMEQIEEVEEMISTKKMAIKLTERKLALPIEALVLYCKMAHPTSAFQITNHPVLTSLIAQGRSEKDGDI